MPYATAADMVARFGEEELIRLSAPEGQLSGPVDLAAVNLALADASGLADSYVYRRFITPVVPAPASLVANVCHLARYGLAIGRNQQPSEAVKALRDEAIAWLEAVGAGRAVLPGATPSTLGAGARVQDRPRMTWPETQVSG